MAFVEHMDPFSEVRLAVLVTSHSGYQSLQLLGVSFFCELLKGDDDQSLLLLECFFFGGSLTTKNRSNWIR